MIDNFDYYLQYRNLQYLFNKHGMNRIESKRILVKVSANSIYCGAHLNDLEIPDSCYFLGLLDGEKFLPTSADPIVKSEDTMVAIAEDPMYVPALKAILEKQRFPFRTVETTAYPI